VSFLDTRDLFAEALDVRAVQVGAGGRQVGAIVDRVAALSVSREEKTWSSRTVPKSSRIVCNGLLNASECPEVRSAGARRGHASINGETPTNARPEVGQGGAGLISLQGR